MGAHGWVVRFYQPSVQSPSRSWIPIMKALRFLRHPTSTLHCSCQPPFDATFIVKLNDFFVQLFCYSSESVSLPFILDVGTSSLWEIDKCIEYTGVQGVAVSGT